MIKTHPEGSFMIRYIPVDPEDEVLRIYAPVAYAG
jgi:hypothetical protein